ncbi:MAG: TonB-dependent receptor plug domain-containing protein, partial [Asticcacaulis sp.]
PDTAVLTTGRSFISGVDSATRGEGLFVGLRGLNPEFSLVLIDGMPVAQGLPHSRSVQMNMIPPEGFGQVLVHRTGRPDLEGDLIAGAIDFRTLRAQDLAERRRAEISLAGRLEPLAHRYDEPGLGGSQALMLAGRFGATDQLGLSLSLRHETRRTVSSEMAGVMSARNDDGWAWGWSSTAGPKYHGTPRDPNHPERDLVLTALNVGVSEVSSQNRSVLLAMDYQPDAHVSLRLTLADLGARNRQNSTLSQVVGGARQWIPDPQGGYRLSLGEVSSRVWYETNPDFVSLKAATLTGRILLPSSPAFRSGTLILTPRLSLSRSASDRPDRIEASIRINQNDKYNKDQAARPYTGQLIVAGKGFPQPLLTPALRDDLDQAATRLLARRAGQRSEQHSAQTRLQAAMDAEWLTGSEQGLVSLKAGLSVSQSDRDVTDLNWTNAPVAEVLGKAGVTWADLGVTKGTWSSVWPGVYDWRAPRVDHDALVALYWRSVTPESFDRCGKLYVNNLNCGTQSGREQVASTYVMSTVRQGQWEITGGLRH